MKHMNNKIAKLLHEGFSMKTLNTFTSNQIDVLYEKVVKSTTEYDLTNNSDEEAFKVDSQNKKPEQVDIDMETKKASIKSEGEVTEKAKSKNQQQFFGIVRGMQKGDIPKKGKAGEAADEMKVKDVKDFAKTKHKGLPKEVKKEKEKKETVKNLEESIMKLISNHFNPEIKKTDVLKMIRKNK